MSTIAQHNARLAKAGLPTLETMTRRVLAAWERSTAAQREAGAQWYAEGQSFCREWSLETKWSLEQCAGVLSHLSPRTDWARNVAGAAHLLRTGEKMTGILSGNYARAASSLVYKDPVDSFGGPKTRRFYLNFLGDSEAVTIDVWALRVVGIEDAAVLSRVGVYDALELAYQRAARRVGVAPSTIQATTWIVARNGRVD